MDPGHVSIWRLNRSGGPGERRVDNAACLSPRPGSSGAASSSAERSDSGSRSDEPHACAREGLLVYSGGQIPARSHSRWSGEPRAAIRAPGSGSGFINDAPTLPCCP